MTLLALLIVWVVLYLRISAPINRTGKHARSTPEEAVMADKTRGIATFCRGRPGGRQPRPPST
jgi:hypothetical protein